MLSFSEYLAEAKKQVKVTRTQTTKRAPSPTIRAFATKVIDHFDDPDSYDGGPYIRLLQHYKDLMYDDINTLLRGGTVDGYTKPEGMSSDKYINMLGGAAKMISRVFAYSKLPAPLTVYRGCNMVSFFGMPKTDPSLIAALNTIKEMHARHRENIHYVQTAVHPDQSEKYSTKDIIASRAKAGERPLPVPKDAAQRAQDILVAQHDIIRTWAHSPLTLRGFTSTTWDINIATNFAFNRDEMSQAVLLKITIPTGMNAFVMGEGTRSRLEKFVGGEGEVLLPHGTVIAPESGSEWLLDSVEYVYTPHYLIPVIPAKVVRTPVS